VTRTLGNGRVELVLGTGEWTARWSSCGVALGPCGTGPDRLRVGAWKIETTRTGARARWTDTDDTAWIELRLPADRDVVEVQTGYRATVDEAVSSLDVLRGAIAPGIQRELVNGYDSWSYAGVRGATDPADSFWSATFVTGDGALALHALTATEHVTKIERSGDVVSVRSEGAPQARQVEGTWGHESLASPGSVRLAPGEEIVSEPVAILAGPDPLSVTEELAALLPRRRWDGPPACGWESWYHYAIAITPDVLRENARLLRDRYRDRPGFDLLQIDDGWQQTHGAWWPRNPFPADLGELVEEIHRLDLRCGLWLAPFMVQPDAVGLGAEHPEWCVRDPETGANTRDRHGRWGLDASNPEVIDFLRELGTQVRDWGVDMVKLDFLYLGAQEGVRHDPRWTGTGSLRRGLGAFVDRLGDAVYVLGCGAPMLPMVGICHANRIGHDLAVPVVARDFGQPLTEGWTGWHGIKAQARQVTARWFTHARWFHNDPEIVMAWGSDGRGGADGYSLEESHTQAVVAALTGGPFLLADELASLLPEERAVLEDADVLDLAWDERGFRPVDLFDHVDAGPLHAYAGPDDLPSVWVAEREPGTVVALFNWTDEPAGRTAPDGTPVELPPHAARVLS
jgi:alpha-galactosidase